MLAFYLYLFVLDAKLPLLDIFLLYFLCIQHFISKAPVNINKGDLSTELNGKECSANKLAVSNFHFHGKLRQYNSCMRSVNSSQIKECLIALHFTGALPL